MSFAYPISPSTRSTMTRDKAERPAGSQTEATSDAWLTISEMAERYGTTLRTLRFYEQRGLLHPIRRGNQRLYDPKTEQRFRLIEQARKLDFTLTEIAEILSSSDNDRELTLSRARIREQIDYLESRHRELNEALGELRKRYYLMSEAVEGSDD
jgi:DNA-binding transcriptional MerR regulator